ncbi:hypothetical protein [Anaerotruncus sp. 1XD42-93]|uniref:hypothetical protein n=1 Tax=Anaerotruncus sp. 1XD42-93 TaxID=2320853 RepID=UPI000EA2FF8A|nr:hypothetical protein [Anaerotruncus sp. 1XD42-93]NBK18074.1 hypothetical protein [Anaerotruncus sp. 1XD42-93]RKJ92408.1 hypothetical protein D7Y41_15015 [Anaerotruncus sp. 1XD22-93]
MKRLVSLTMAAACALSLAVPAFAVDKTDVIDSGSANQIEAAVSGYEETIKGEEKVATSAFGKANATVADFVPNLGLTGINVKVATGESNASVALKVAKAIDAKVGYTAYVRYNSPNGTWRELLGDVPTVLDTTLDENTVVVDAAYNATIDRGNAVLIENMTLDDLFYNFASDRAGDDIELVFGSSAKNDDDGVLPNKTAYMVVKGVYEKTSDLGIDVKAVEGGKYIKSIKDTSKSFGTGGEILVDVNGNKIDFQGRYRVIEIKFKENMTDDEFKVVFDVKVRAKKAVNGWAIGETKKFEDVAETWISNNLWDLGDGDWAAGQGGWMIQPLKNEENEIIWYDENKDIAKVEFYADSDTDKFFAKLSTKWNNEWYSDMFRNTDAFIFNFVGAPKISATSRATLTIYNPFVNDEDELEVDLDELKVYKVLDTAALAATTEEAIAEAIADGRIEDVTNLFTAGENEDGDQVLTTRTRDLGTYIVTTATPADLVDDVVVDSTNNGKVNPGTGR